MVIVAAGGVIWRPDGQGGREVLVVHRPRRRDWSLPKGRLRSNETPLECAIREVREETGMRCRAVGELPECRYEDRKGRPRLVRYWEMSGFGGRFRPNDEVDQVRWVPVARLAGVLTYERELIVVAAIDVTVSIAA